MKDEIKSMSTNKVWNLEPIVTHEEEQQQPQTEDVPNVEAPKRSQRVRKSAIPADYKVYNTE